MRHNNKTRIRLPILKNLVNNILEQLQFLSLNQPNFHETSYDILQDIYDSLNQSLTLVESMMIGKMSPVRNINNSPLNTNNINIPHANAKTDTSPLPVVQPISHDTNMEAIIETLNNIEDYVVRTYRICKKAENKDDDIKSNVLKIFTDTVQTTLQGATFTFKEENYSSFKEEHTTITSFK